MPSFFLSAEPKSKTKTRGSLKRNLKDGDDKEARLSRRKRMMAQTEISSDEEGSISSANVSVGSDDEYDDIHDRNYRQAKQLLSMFNDGKRDAEEIGELLKEDAASRAGVLRKELADSVEIQDDEEINHRGHRFTPLCVAVSPCAKFVISTGKESSIVKYDIINRKVVGIIRRRKGNANDEKAHFGHIFAVAVSSDGRYIASGGQDAVLKIWDLLTLAHVRDFTGHRAPITSICFQHKTNNLFSSSRDRSVKLWDLDQLGMVDTMYGHQDAVLALSVLQKQRVVTAGSQDRSCRLWKVEDESQLLFSGFPNCISMDCVAMLNDDHFVSGSADGSLCVWSVWKKKPIAVRRLIHGLRAGADPRWVVSVSAVPYSDLVATGSDDGELKLWKVSKDFRNISQVFSYSINGFINDIKFSIDGSLLALAVGQEHKDGRWWVDKEAKNQVIILPIHYISGEMRKSVDDIDELASDASDNK